MNQTDKINYLESRLRTAESLLEEFLEQFNCTNPITIDTWNEAEIDLEPRRVTEETEDLVFRSEMFLESYDDVEDEDELFSPS